MTALPPSLDVRRATDRARTATAWLDSRHSFSSGRHYDPANTSYGLLVANDDHRVRAGAGFALHRHRDVEIVTWVLEGSLVHEDSTGSGSVVSPGQVQRTSAGRGIAHSERCGSAVDGPARDVRFVQMWVVPDESGTAPGHEQQDLRGELASGGLVTVASGRSRHHTPAVRLATRHAALHAARLRPGRSVVLPDAPYLHLFVPVGSVELEDVGALGAGDAVRCTATGGRRVTATEPAELLVWEMHAALGG